MGNRGSRAYRIQAKTQATQAKTQAKRMDRIQLAIAMVAVVAMSMALPESPDKIVPERLVQDTNAADGAKAASNFYGSQLSDMQKKQVTVIFKMFNKEHDGELTHEEMRKMLDILGQKATDENVEDLFKTFDNNKDSKLDFEEFTAVIAPHMAHGP